VCAVNYLNTAPLVWGLSYGSQRGLFNIAFSSPADCADRLARGDVDIGLAPVIEIQRLGLEAISDVGIACRGEIRSILLISKKPLRQVRVLAADVNSRTSVLLARLFLAEQGGCAPAVTPEKPDLRRMLSRADAALLIGDAALRMAADPPPFEVWDLGAEWNKATGLPMVFALWAGRPNRHSLDLHSVFRTSWTEGRMHLEEIIRRESPARRLPEPLVRDYLTRCLVHEIGPREREGLRLFLKMAARFDTLKEAGA